LSGRGLCDELITRPEESYRLYCVVVCDLETSRMGAPYIYDISHLRVNAASPYAFSISSTVFVAEKSTLQQNLIATRYSPLTSISQRRHRVTTTVSARRSDLTTTATTLTATHYTNN